MYLYDVEDDDEQLTKEMIVKYFNNKVEGYKQQDKKGNRHINEKTYVGPTWCIEKSKGCCEKCGVKFEIELNNCKLTSYFTAQRLDNNFAHTIDNCQAWCVYCNCSAC